MGSCAKVVGSGVAVDDVVVIIAGEGDAWCSDAVKMKIIKILL